jgi:hypothetical protein
VSDDDDRGFVLDLTEKPGVGVANHGHGVIKNDVGDVPKWGMPLD